MFFKMKGGKRMKKITMLILSTMLIFSTGSIQVFAEEKPETIHEEIIYDILVDRFNNGDQSESGQIRLDDPYAFHGGDIEGIIMKLDNLKELGFTTISLSPIMSNAPDGYHGYWIEDFFEVDEQFGTMDDLQKLVDEAHDRDMKVILELVTNYAAETHPLTTDPEKEGWIDQNKTKPVEDYPWLEEVVSLNQEHPDVENYLLDVAEYWLQETDIDGYKLHAADEASPSFLEKLTEHIKEVKSDAYIVADVLEEDTPALHNIENIQLVKNTDMFQALTEVFSREDIPVQKLYEQWQETENQSGLLYVDDKFTKRFTQLFAEQGRNKVTVWKLALTYMYTAPGVPLIYQGSEIPMYGEGVPSNQTMVDFNSGDADVKEYMERISALRTEFKPLMYGDFELVDSNQGMSVFKRTYEDESVYIAINNDSESREISLESLGADKQLRGLLNDNLARENKDGEFRIGLPRETAEVYIIEENTGINWLFIGFVATVLLIFIGGVVYLSRKQKKTEANKS